MSALLGRNARYDASAGPLPRVSRLTDAAVAFLVAASGVFFVCAQASSAILKNPDPPNVPNVIRHMTGPHYDSENDSYNVVVGESFTATAKTNIYYDRVEWFIMTPAVWEREQPERKFANPVYVSDKPGTKASFPHTFAEGEGGEGRTLESGRQYHIVARAFSNRDPENEDDAAVYQIPIRVHEGKKKFVHTRVGSDGVPRYEVYMGIHWMDISREDIDGDGDKNEWKCEVYWDHSIKYYNDIPGGDTGRAYAYVKLYEVWNGKGVEISTEFTADEAGLREEPRIVWNLDITYKGSASAWEYRIMRSDGDTSRPAELVPERRYYLYGETRLQNTDEKRHEKEKLDKKKWDFEAVAEYTTETRKFDPVGGPGQFWVEGYNYTPPKSEEAD